MDETSKLTPILKFNIVLLCAVNITFTFVGVFLNSVVIVSLLNSQLRQKLCYFMILVLAFFDLPVVLVFHPLITVKTLLCCKQFTNLDSLVPYLRHLYTFSMAALITMAVERYLALMYPFCHQKFITKSKLAAVFLIFLLPFGALHCVLHILQLNRSDVYIESGIILSIIGVFVLVLLRLNFKVFYLARKLQKCADITLGSLDGSEQGNAKGKYIN